MRPELTAIQATEEITATTSRDRPKMVNSWEVSARSSLFCVMLLGAVDVGGREGAVGGRLSRCTPRLLLADVGLRMGPAPQERSRVSM